MRKQGSDVAVLVDGYGVEVQTAEVIATAEINQQIATAKNFPRVVSKSLAKATTLALTNEETAAACFYALPRAGKLIEGPSVRLAEIMAHAWGNLRVDAEVTGESETHLEATGTTHDLETNVAIRIRVKRRITKRNGKRFDDDMIAVAANAATSIALRNAIFKVIPRVFTDQIFQAARQAAMGKGGTITQKRQLLADWFRKLGLQSVQVCQLVGVAALDDIGQEELVQLRGVATAIQDGETTVETLKAQLVAQGGADGPVVSVGADKDAPAQDGAPDTTGERPNKAPF